MKIPSSLIPGFLSIFTAAQGATVFSLDFDNGGSPSASRTQTGWEAFTETAEANNKTMTFSGYTGLSSGNISITTSNVAFTRNHDNANNAPPDFPGTDLDSIYNDLVLRNNLSADLQISISGLKAGTYQITTYHLVTVLPADSVSTFNLLVQDADSPSFGQNVGSFSMGRRNQDLSAFTPTVVNFNVTSNGSDNILLRLDGQTLGTGGSGQVNWIGINGLEIEVIPEPGAALLGAIGLIVLLRRRRA